MDFTVCATRQDATCTTAKNITGSLNQQTRMEVESMKTLPLKEVLKLATPGKLTADYMRRVYTNDGEFWIASTDTSGPATDEEAVANAALLAHSMNIRDELIEALEKAESWMGLSTREDTERDQAALDEAARECRAVLAKARTVEMP